MAGRIEQIRASLQTAFAPTVLEVIDESHMHVGHAGARDGKGHFRVIIVSPRFEGRKPLERHRMVFDALADLLKTDIHALSVTAAPPRSEAHSDELQSKGPR